MDDSQKSDFSVCMGALFSVFGQEATRAHLQGYWMGLCDLDLETVRVAVAKAIREKDRLASPSELRKLCGRSQSSESLSEIAWLDVLRALPMGPYKHIDFSDKVCNAVIRGMGGWPNFLARFTDSESENWVKKEFVRSYQNLHAVGISEEMAKPLAGLSTVSISNGIVGDPVPIRIECQAAIGRIAIHKSDLVRKIPMLEKVST